MKIKNKKTTQEINRLYDNVHNNSHLVITIDGIRREDIRRVYKSKDSTGLMIHFMDKETSEFYRKNRVQLLQVHKKSKGVQRRLDYFHKVSQYIDNIGFDDERGSKPFFYKRCFTDIQPLVNDTCLNWYLSRKPLPESSKKKAVIFPCSLTFQQLSLVDDMLSNQVTLLDAAPHTGKESIILTLVANAVISGKTIAIVSDNKALLERYYSEIKHLGLVDYCAPFLDNRNYNLFFNKTIQKNTKKVRQQKKQNHIDEKAIKECVKIISENQKIELEYNTVTTELCRLEDEAKYFKFFSDEFNKYDDQQLFEEMPQEEVSESGKFSTNDFILDQAIDSLGQSRTSRFFKYFSRYKILTFKHNDARNAVARWLNHVYEQKYLQKIDMLKNEKSRLRKMLRQRRVAEAKNSLIQLSQKYLENYLINRAKQSKRVHFQQGDERLKYPLFSEQYPIIVTQLSKLTELIPYGTSLDYIIVDESEKVSLVPGIFALSKAKSTVIVGNSQAEDILLQKDDTHFLPRIEPEYDYFTQTLFSSVQSMLPSENSVALYEFVSGQPYILNFLNRFFYDNELSLSYKRRPNSFSLGMFYVDSNTRIDAKLDDVCVSDKDVHKQLGYSIFESVYELNEAKNIHIMTPFQKSPFPTNTLKKTLNDDAVIYTTEVSRGNDIYYRKIGNVSATVYDALSRANRLFVLGVGENPNLIENSLLYALQGYINYFGEYELVSSSATFPIFEELYNDYYEYFLDNSTKFNSSSDKMSALSKIKAEVNQALNFISDVTLQVITLYPLHVLVRKYSQIDEHEREYIRKGDYSDVLIYDSYWKKVVGIVEMNDYTGFSERELYKVQTRESIYDKLEIPHITVSLSELDSKTEIATFVSQLPRIRI